MASQHDEVLKRIKVAVESAASNGDPISLLATLSEEQALSGLVWRLQGRWRVIPSEDLLDIICFSIDQLFYKVREGQLITNPMGFLWKTADNKAHEYYRRAKKTKEIDGTDKMIKDPTWERDLDQPDPKEWDEREKQRAEGLRIARSLLPKMRSENIRNVMAYILDAIEQGFEEVDNSDIAEACGLTQGTVRDCKFRGFQRLSRLAIAEKVIDEPFDFLQSDDGSDDDEDEDISNTEEA